MPESLSSCKVGFSPGIPAGSPWTPPNTVPSVTTLQTTQTPGRNFTDPRGGQELKWMSSVPLVETATFGFAHYYTYLDNPALQVFTQNFPLPITGGVAKDYSALAVQSAQRVAITGGTLNQQGSLVMEATRVGKETLLSQIVSLVAQAQRSRASIQRLADVVAAWFVPTVIGVAVLAFIGWLLWGPDPALSYGLVAAVAVLIIACPCALGLATPNEGNTEKLRKKECSRLRYVDILITNAGHKKERDRSD